MSAPRHAHGHTHGHGHGGGPVTILPPGAHFDEIAALYNASLLPHVVRHYLQKRVRFVRERLPSPALVVDVGCGTGLLAQRLAGQGYDVVGLDLSLGMLLQGGKALRYAQGDAAALPFPDAAFDGAVTVAALHHIFEPAKVAATIAEMVRVTRPGEILRAVKATGADDLEVVRSGWMPDFAPRWATGAFEIAETMLELLPLVKELSAHNVIVVWR